MSEHDNENIVAITGANGFIGRHLVKRLSERDNISLRLLVRNPADNSKKLSSNITEVHGDLSKIDTLKELLVPGCTVINLAYSFHSDSKHNLAMIENLISASKDKKVRRIIHCSTASVYGRTNEKSVNEESKCHPRSNYGKTKLLIEEMLHAGSHNKYQYVNVRPTAVYGPGGDALLKLMGNLVDGSMMLNYLRACLFGVRRMNLVSIHSVVAAIIFLLDQDERVDGETFIVSEDQDPANNYQYVESYLLGRLTDRRYFIPPILLPIGILSLLLRMLGRDTIDPLLVYDSGKLKKAGYLYEKSIESGLEEMATWYQEGRNKD